MSKLKKNLKLFYRLLLVVLPFLVLSIILASVVLTWTSYRFSLLSIRRDYQSILKSSAGEIRSFMKSAVKGLEGLSMVVATTQLDPWQQKMALAGFINATSEFMSITLVSVTGEEQSAVGQPGEHIVYNENMTFKRSVSGNSSVSGVMLTPEEIPYVHVAVPIHRQGKVAGVLWAKLNLKAIWNVLGGINVGNTGTVYIMDIFGRLIGNRDINSVMNSRQMTGPEIIEKLKTAVEVPVEWTEARTDGSYYSLGITLQDLGWVIVLSQLDTEIYASLYSNIRWAVLITLVICVVAIILGWNRMDRFLDPIHDLHRQVKKIGGGDLDHRVQVDSNDEIGELSMAFNDMVDSLRKYINKEVEKATEVAHDRSLAVVGTVYSTVTHEMGNYLNNAMLISAGMSDEPLTPKGLRYMELLKNDTVRVHTFIKSFMQLVRKPDLQLAKISLESLIQDTFFVYRSETEQRGIELKFDWNPDLPAVRADPRFLHQVLNNLIKNALEAIPNSGVIEIRPILNGEYLKLVVEDNGPGMPENIRDHVFDPFFTTKDLKGSGLGLPFCRFIMEAHRGSIECRSEVGKGTSFILMFPLH